MELKLTNLELTNMFSNVLYPNTKLNESLTSSDKSDIKDIVQKEIKDFLTSNKNATLEKKVKDVIKDLIKGDKEMEKYVLTITKNVLIQLYKNLWMRRSFWSNDLKNTAS